MPDKARIKKYEQRADELADIARRLLVGLNSGGIVVVISVAAAIAAPGLDLGWVFWPALLFVMGLGTTAISILYAKHKALKRRDALREEKKVPSYTSFMQRNFYWEIAALVLFAAGFFAALLAMDGIQIPRV